MKSILTIAFALLAVAPLAAQSEQAVVVGARVRVTVPDTTPNSEAAEKPGPLVVVGKVVAIDDSTMLIRNDASEAGVTISRDRIQRFEVGTGTNRRRAAGTGGVIGIVLGGVWGYASGDDCSDQDFICFQPEDTALMGAALGALVGAGIGFLAGGERWRDAGLPARVGFVPTSSRSMVITSTLRF